MSKYNPAEIESKWQKKWEQDKLYETKVDSNKKKYYVLDMFPYPSGTGLHVGHLKGYIATDVIARMRMMQGYNVLHPMGWDAFGLPAENYAIKNKIHPSIATAQNIANYKRQLGLPGLSYDWSREVNTTDSNYYKWTQWAFIQMFKKGLVNESYEPINWCPECKTGLANEDLEDGKCERCGSVVERKPLRQWEIEITKYADRLLNDLDILQEWPEHIKEMQRNWIGRSEGALINFSIAGADDKIEVFTTRPDTLFGVTYVVLAPEHPLIAQYKDRIENFSEVEKYIEESKNKSDLERSELQKEKTGIKIEGLTAINPANNETLPIFVADYVLGGYGTGAVMAVPAHDERDFAFAKKYGLPMKKVVEPITVYETGDSAIQKDLPFIKRENVCAIVLNPKNGKYLCVDWKKFNMHGLITGGVDEGEDVVEAAKREVVEESGYKNLRVMSNPGFAIHTKFFHRVKKQNRWARFQYVFLELENEERNEISADEKAVHELVWKTKKEMDTYFTVAEGEFANKLINNPEYIFVEDGILHNSGQFDDLFSSEARKKITETVGGEMVTRYKLRDWVFSRQRYWGEPIPLVNCEKCGWVPVPESELPLKLPDVKNYEPSGTGESPLANITEWVNTKCPTCGGPAKRETNTMPQWAGSCWYYLAYAMPRLNDGEYIWDKDQINYWNPVDCYVGGAEHATRHLIYARFWHKFLYDIGAVQNIEPFMRLHSVGLILGEDSRKMSKRWGNVINPDDVVEKFGADALRLYEMFMGPFGEPCAWDTNGLVGCKRFLDKVCLLSEKVVDKNIAEKSKLKTSLHQTIKKVGEDIEGLRYNTAIAKMMSFANDAGDSEEIVRTDFKMFVQVLAPFAPHLAEDLWNRLGEKESIFKSDWPKYDPELAKSDEMTIAIQVNGKLRDTLVFMADTDEEEIKSTSLASEKVKKWLDGHEPKKVIYVKGRLVSIVV